MKKISSLIMAVVTVFSLAACAQKEEKPAELDVSQMKAICDLAVMDCYYHNVAKFKEEDAAGALWWKKDKHFWVEYDTVVTLSIDASLVEIAVDGTDVTITLPAATVQGGGIDSETFSYIVAKGSAPIVSDDEQYALVAAKQDLMNRVKSDTALLDSAQQRAKELLTQYIENIGEEMGQEYNVTWVLLDAEGNPQEAASANTDAQKTEQVEAK